MPKIEYVARKFSPQSQRRIEQANDIIAEYESQGFVLTLRQLYYQFVSRDLLPNTPQSYDNLGSLMTDARLAGLVDWDAIEDRTRSLKSNNHWNSPGEIVEACANQYRVSRWQEQGYWPEVWIEKEALAGVFDGVCRELDVPYFSCRGYGSASEMWRAGCRLKDRLDEGKTPIILHFGDHDPSGLDMTRDITDRLALFAEEKIEVIRVALTMDQINQYEPPPNPAKMSDARAPAYVAEYGESSWELDALEPAVLVQLVRDHVGEYMDRAEWDRTGKVQEKARKDLKSVAKNFDKAVSLVKPPIGGS